MTLVVILVLIVYFHFHIHVHVHLHLDCYLHFHLDLLMMMRISFKICLPSRYFCGHRMEFLECLSSSRVDWNFHHCCWLQFNHLICFGSHASNYLQFFCCHHFYGSNSFFGFHLFRQPSKNHHHQKCYFFGFQTNLNRAYGIDC